MGFNFIALDPASSSLPNKDTQTHTHTHHAGASTGVMGHRCGEVGGGSEGW